MLSPGNTWDTLAFRRRLETFGQDGEAVLAGPGAVVDGVWYALCLVAACWRLLDLTRWPPQPLRRTDRPRPRHDAGAGRAPAPAVRGRAAFPTADPAGARRAVPTGHAHRACPREPAAGVRRAVSGALPPQRRHIDDTASRGSSPECQSSHSRHECLSAIKSRVFISTYTGTGSAKGVGNEN